MCGEGKGGGGDRDHNRMNQTAGLLSLVAQVNFALSTYTCTAEKYS